MKKRRKKQSTKKSYTCRILELIMAITVIAIWGGVLLKRMIAESPEDTLVEYMNHIEKRKTAELKATKEDTSGKEIRWFSVFTAEENVDRPILLISMVENVKGIGGSGYVVKKDATVLEEYFEK
jgi:hypothetical protein